MAEGSEGGNRRSCGVEGIRGTDASLFRSQLVRAAFSVPANIAEGRSQESERQFSRFLKIALNSSTEVEYHLLTCRDIGALDPDTTSSLILQTVEVRKMIYGLLSRIRDGPRASAQ